MPTFAPVPKAKDKGPQYDNRPFSSGPYKIESYERGKKLVLVRNTQLGRRRPTTVRKALPGQAGHGDGAEANQIDDRLIASQGADASAVSWGALRPESAAKVLPDAGGASG